ncbi:hypothetical protein BHM03_00023631 [Ensete ventricosum]|nr:hypothetical protein BHM03_00023631 [Ensete ventricosum]
MDDRPSVMSVAYKAGGTRGKRGTRLTTRKCTERFSFSLIMSRALEMNVVVRGAFYTLTLLDLRGAVETILAKGRNLASAFAGAEQDISCLARRSSPKGMIKMEHGAETRSFPWTKVKGTNSCSGKSEIMSFRGFLILMGRLNLHGAKDKGSFEAHASYLRDAFDIVTKVIQLAEENLGSGDLSTGQEDVEAGILKEYATVLPFELLGTSGV